MSRFQKFVARVSNSSEDNGLHQSDGGAAPTQLSEQLGLQIPVVTLPPLVAPCFQWLV